MALLLILPKDNRHWQSWLILLPLPVMPIFWQVLEQLLPMSPGTGQLMSWLFGTLLSAWVALWLLAPRFYGRHPVVAIALALAVVHAIAGVSYWGHFGFTAMAESSPMWIMYSSSVCALLLGMVLSARSCRRFYSPKRFMLYLLLWIAAIFGIVGALTLAYEAVQMGMSFVSFLPMMIVAMTMSTLVMGGFLYVMNLPFLVLAFYCPTYRNRFHNVFRLPERERLGD